MCNSYKRQCNYTIIRVTLPDATELLILILLHITMYFLVQLYKTQTNNTLLLRETPFIVFDQSPMHLKPTTSIIMVFQKCKNSMIMVQLDHM